MADRYLKIVLTVIALELLWLIAGTVVKPVSAQVAATPVVITGVQFETGDAAFLPVAVRGTVTVAPAGPLKVEADRPLPVESVPFTPTARPGQ
jgi:hypothetical protein